MTERMENTIRHIKSGVDVDPWAADEVERVFKAVDDIKIDIKSAYDELDDVCIKNGLNLALKVIDKHINGKEK